MCCVLPVKRHVASFAESNDKASTTAGEERDTSAVRQLLGIKDAGETTNIWKIRLQLTKPVTWAPLIWGKF